MNKSTPISQLPASMQTGNGNFINEQQKQMITQAQQAISTMSMPQSSHNLDIASEDDATIQEVLNQINRPSSPQPQVSIPPPQEPVMHSPPPQVFMPQQVPFQQYAPPPPQIDLQSLYGLLQQQNQTSAIQDMSTTPPGNVSNVASVTSNVFEQFINVFGEDIKLGLIIIVAYTVIQFAPVTKLLSKYVAIEKIPHHTIIINSLIMALIVILTKRVLFK